MLSHEAGNHFADLKIDHRGRTADSHHALRLGARAVDDLLRSIGLDQHRHTVTVVFAADLGHGEAPGRALDQSDAEAAFQEADTPAEPGSRHAELAGGGGEAILLDDLGEETQIVQVLHGRQLSYI